MERRGLDTSHGQESDHSLTVLTPLAHGTIVLLLISFLDIDSTLSTMLMLSYHATNLSVMSFLCPFAVGMLCL